MNRLRPAVCLFKWRDSDGSHTDTGNTTKHVQHVGYAIKSKHLIKHGTSTKCIETLNIFQGNNQLVGQVISSGFPMTFPFELFPLFTRCLCCYLIGLKYVVETETGSVHLKNCSL